MFKRCFAMIAVLMLWCAATNAASNGTPEQPLQVMLIPADGGTASGTLADFQPLFDAVSKTSGLMFQLRVGDSYGAVVEALKAKLVDIAWLGPVAYVQAHSAGAAEMLGVAVSNGESAYYSGIFVRHNASFKSLEDLKGKRLALGDVNSGSSFTYPIDMLLKAGVDPARDLAAVRLTGSHSASLAALAEGHVDAAGLSFESFSKAANSGAIDAKQFRVLGRSDPIPNPPLALSTALPRALKATLREAFANVHSAPGISPEMIRGYGGARVDRYDTRV
ncbi:MAG TPA: phosphate/phosphite/phosphonate ABC transporter substrate-binding protein, partial [Steroidobacteraceae bacterium]|nr:phosphate/phosphite/phosphonate ABC transporter substrate-binding protein [Steroidobacteraceae bacterium]